MLAEVDHSAGRAHTKGTITGEAKRRMEVRENQMESLARGDIPRY